MGTVEQESREQMIKWLTEGIRNGSLKAEPVYDDEHRIISVSIILADDPRTTSQGRRAHRDDPRRQQPL